MNQKKSKSLRKEAKLSAGDMPWMNYESIKSGLQSWQVQVVLAECGKALYKELKKEYYKKES